jgi:radical SAM family uncharacterized protein
MIQNFDIPPPAAGNGMPTIDDLKDKFLPFVKNPGQYIGREINSVTKEWDQAHVRVALAFPDAYTIGASSLAVSIVYHLLNTLPNVLCERVFCPLPDAADRLRELNWPLLSLESHRPVRDFDILAISVPYEMLYTNVLELLDLARIPLLAADRKSSDPLVLIGGSQANNPEPIADFIDLAILGEAEAALPPFVDLFARLKRETRDRNTLLTELARSFPWVYAPSLYNIEYHPDGTIRSIDATVSDIPMPVSKAYVSSQDFDTGFAPTKPIVPYVQTVHDRLNIEIMRGCPHACRFCNEGHTRRPLRMRSAQRIVQLARESFANTGLTEISLCSLSSADYPELETLFAQMNRIFAPMNVSIALPSLRAEKQLRLIPEQTSLVRKSPLTIAIEAADPLIREVINKPIDDEAIFAAVKEAYRCGWQQVKLYFIIGLPGEQLDRLSTVVDLADRIARIRTELGKGPAKVSASLSIFVPKAHTPLQWIGQPGAEYLSEARHLLRSAARTRRYLQLKFHDQEQSFLEAAFARGDRRLGSVIIRAWRAGARFDAWNDSFRYERFQQAFEDSQLNPHFYANRTIGLDEVLPWEHLQPGSAKPILRHQLELALAPIGGMNNFAASSERHHEKP